MSLNDGDIPGPYWAVLSHPATSKELGEQMFADVHMLSHLVGASNRANICKLQEVEEHIANLDQKFNRQQRQHIKSLERRDETIMELRSAIRNIQVTQEISVASSTTSPKPYKLLHPVPTRDSFSSLHKNISHLSGELQASNSHVEQADKKIKDLEILVADLRDENINLERAFLQNGQDDSQASPLDLTGQCLLYVGGQLRTVHRLRDLVEDWNGKFIHHDGGIESSINELASAVTRADTVVFPIDCVSHSAANKVKRLCHQSMKPFITLRTSGVGSFVIGLRDALKITPLIN
jgi:archaellum component FlaC